MAVGDMKYSFTDLNGEEQRVEIPAEVLRKGKRQGLSNRDSIMKYLFENGFAVEQPKAAAKTSRATSRTPDKHKQEIIEAIAENLEPFGEVNIINAERQVQVFIDGDVFEVTLVKKRKPKTKQFLSLGETLP